MTGRDWRSAAETLGRSGSARAPQPDPLRLRQGTVVAVNTGAFPIYTADLQLGGDVTSTIPSVQCLASYRPRVNDGVGRRERDGPPHPRHAGWDPATPYAENVVTTTVSVSAAAAGTQAISFAASRFTVAPSSSCRSPTRRCSCRTSRSHPRRRG